MNRRKRPWGGIPKSKRAQQKQVEAMTRKINTHADRMLNNPQHSHDYQSRKTLENKVNRRGSFVTHIQSRKER